MEDKNRKGQGAWRQWLTGLHIKEAYLVNKYIYLI